MNGNRYALIESFLAKSDGTTLIAHTEDVLTGARNLLDRLPLPVDERTFFEPRLIFCAIFHDLGKIHPFFQAILKNEEEHDGIRHEIISAWIIEHFMEAELIERFAIATHHRGVTNAPAKKRLESVILNEMFKKHVADAENGFRQTIAQLPEILRQWCEYFHVAREIHEPEVKREHLSDDLRDALNIRYQKEIFRDETERLRGAQLRGLLMAADHLGSALIHNSVPDYKSISLSDFEPCDKETGERLPLRDFQKNLLDRTSDVILHAPTGSGKTEAALAWVTANQLENNRIFYLLPFTASINAMVGRLQSAFGENRVTPLHSRTLDFFYERLQDEVSNFEQDQENDDSENVVPDVERLGRRDAGDHHHEKAKLAASQKQARTMKSFSRELYFPVKVATPHQIIKHALFGRGWDMALSDYHNACFIIDEFHAYDPFLTGLMLGMVRWLKTQFNAKFFFMSATIPRFLEKLLIEHIFGEDEQNSVLRPSPNSASDREILDRKRHRIFCMPECTVDKQFELIEKLLARGKKVLIVVNNVKTAQAIFSKIKFSGSKRLLHSGFHRRDRIEIENAITDKKNAPQLLVATQAVEVSLDISYDAGFIELAPVDALIQRFGRINRNPDKNKPVVAPIYLFEKIIGNTPFYRKHILESTWKRFLELDQQIVSEQDLVEVCNAVYGNGYEEDDLRDFEHGLTNETIVNYTKSIVAGDWRDWIEDVLGERGNLKIDVLCGNCVEEYKQLKKKGRYIEANQLLVPVYFWELRGKPHNDERLNVIVAYNLHYYHQLGYLRKDESFEDVCI